MKPTAVYLDTLNAEMEKMILSMCPPDVNLKFLDPKAGEKGTLEEADCFIVTTYETTREVIDKAPNLKLIQRTGVGVDMVDIAHAREKGIPVSICKGFNSGSVAELAVLGMLALYRHLTDLDRLGKKGEWHTWTFRHDSFELDGKTIGIYGGGAIGKEVMRRVKCFNTKIIYSDVYRMPEEQEKELGCAYVEFEEMLEKSDIISIHVPLLDSTTGRFGTAEFEKMKPSAVLINTARGQIVDTDALLDALKTQKIWGAAIDCFSPEDPFFGMDGLNLITTPHIGAATYDNYHRGYEFCLQNIQRLGRGEPLQFLKD